MKSIKSSILKALLFTLIISSFLCISFAQNQKSHKLNISPPPKSIQLTQNQYLTFQSLSQLQKLKSYQFNKISLNSQNLYPYLQKIFLRLSKKYHQLNNQQNNSQSLITVSQQSFNNTQAYSILISSQNIQIKIASYSGYVYALQTLSQIISYNQTISKFQIPLLLIQDQPLLQYRGLMIDSVRHFLSVSAIQKLLNSMPLFKLNVLHWHLSDDEAFPIKLATHPQLSQGAYSPSQVYSPSDITKLLAVASKNAIKIIPQIDTPAHVRSWGLSSKWKSQNITKICPGGEGYNAQFNVSNPLVWNLTEQVIKQVANIFKDSPYIHLGGDEVFGKCWDLIPQIKKFMEQKNLSTYGQLQMYWRSQLKKVLPADKKVIFWRNNADGVKTEPNDILHYWGAQNQTSQFVNGSQSKIIMSQSDYLYLNKGQGFIWGNQFGHYTIWKQLYKQLTVFPNNVAKQRILGAQACLWGQVSNEDTLQNNLWMRGAAFSYRVWSGQMLNTVDLVSTLVKAQKSLIDIGVNPSPVTTEFCEIHTQDCFKNINQDQQLQLNKKGKKSKRRISII